MKIIFIFTICLLAVVVNCSKNRKKWQSYKRLHLKTYESLPEEENR